MKRLSVILLSFFLVFSTIDSVKADTPTYPSSVENSIGTITARIEAVDTVIYPSSSPHERLTLTVGQQVSMVVVIIPVTSQIIWDTSAPMGCDQPFNDRSQQYEWLVCTFLNPDIGTYQATFTLTPRYLFVSDLSQVCSTSLYWGFPIQVYVEGLELLGPGTKVWTPYIPGFCGYLPLVNNN